MEPQSLCPLVEKGIQMLSKRWTVLIVHQLLAGPQRFGAIEEAIPISGRLLSERLKELEQEGIVMREVFPETPVRIQYSLTDKGYALKPMIREIEKWSREWIVPEDAERPT
ncbi:MULTISPECIES: helix-turn-helix domain-containing protein [unclassified Paenibacillus]|uniref:winged helix-turn-helix transcriptional regulator n=1 Tax=unclassified Paenibacillus TaxID=185978 RepID=UPI001C10EA7B|nr:MULTISPECIES: winged helix-turn-helix transcriptional regulator [unclassified Paenibacillus]MBU5443604.1 winged helix-turn-helix transcriptional regulator [Paenibacillus sp. MSJ-34]CAH0119998.1 HTH-type transcriptional regulator YodB [Paenibacillus sp. CECT 9249]